MEEEKRYALLIDADNVSSKYIDIVTKEAQSFGNVTIRRIYGDWTSNLKNSWKECLLNNALSPIQQYSYTTRKNSSDAALIIDAMDILYTDNVDGFILVSSDSDFTKLAMRLRESGKHVVGMGESKTPTPFVRACEQFKTLDVLYENAVEQKKRPTPKYMPKRNRIKVVSSEPENVSEAPIAEPITNLKAIKATIFSLLDENSDEDGWMYLSELGNMIQKTYSDFDFRNYGYTKFGKMIESFPELQTRKDDSSNGITKIILVRKREEA
ncbi:NYN domain-containing protein [Roseburia sp. 499]|uniref:NYN domain-containing protein n=1 Tax=Roseburia sp. 499 TaxID=1261634 RepID=UPI00095277BC|nr:NYN domain-containing protein [Roseburia sp. 499]WVK68687.1 NYN domain-containing protein [Roseburia sp. 499]